MTTESAVHGINKTIYVLYMRAFLSFIWSAALPLLSGSPECSQMLGSLLTYLDYDSDKQQQLEGLSNLISLRTLIIAPPVLRLLSTQVFGYHGYTACLYCSTSRYHNPLASAQHYPNFQGCRACRCLCHTTLTATSVLAHSSNCCLCTLSQVTFRQFEALLNLDAALRLTSLGFDDCCADNLELQGFAAKPTCLEALAAI